MPIIVDPGAVNPPAPVQVTSPDGILTATVDADHGGVLLEAAFLTDEQSAVFGADKDGAPDGWALYTYAPGVGSVSVAGGSLVFTVTTGGGSVGGTWSLPTPIDGESKVDVRFTWSVNVPSSYGRWRVALAGADGRIGDAVDLDVTGTDGGSWTARLAVPAGLTATQVVLYTNAVDSGTVWTVRDVSVGVPEPVAVRFVRADGTPVRSGDPAPAPGGLAVAYDHEAPLHTAVAWEAVPIYADGSAGTPSQQVAIETPGVPQGDGPLCRSVWVKAIDNPGASLPLSGIEPLPTLTRSSRAALQSVPGTPFPAGAIDVASSVGTQLYFLTLHGSTDVKAIEALFTTGSVLLVQWSADFDEADRYFLVTGDLSRTGFGTMRTGKWQWSVEVTEVARPATVDAALFIPGRSYDEVAALAPTYDQRLASWPTYQDVWSQ